jgi:hypothetical protein
MSSRRRDGPRAARSWRLIWLTLLCSAGPACACGSSVAQPDAANPTESSPESGWTQFTPSKDTQRIYVSSSAGNDANDGRSPEHAKRTIAAGTALLRDGFPDWLLFKKGDVFDGSFANWGLSGRSLAERMLISSYGAGERPLIRSGSASGIYTAGGRTANNIAIVGLHFSAHTYSGGSELPRGVAWFGGTENFLLEDCCIERYETNVVVQGFPEGLRHKNVALRRNVVVEAYNTGSSNSEGIYVSGTDGLLIEENVLDHNGWVDSIPGSLPTFFRRNAYIQNGNTGVVFRGNLLAGTDGAQVRPGGIIADNLVVRCVCGIHVGYGDEPEPAGISATISSNVVIGGRSLDAAHPGIFGMRLSNLIGGSIKDNIIANADSSKDVRALWFSTIRGFDGPIARNVTVSGNVCHRGGFLVFEGSESQYSAIVLDQNVIQSTAGLGSLVRMGSAASAAPARVGGKRNTWWVVDLPPAQWVLLGDKLEPLSAWLARIGDTTSTAHEVAFADPGRDTGTYNASLGGTGTHEAFMAECRKQSRDNWRPQYTAAAANAYIRSGFLRPNQAGPGGTGKPPR